uniref:PKD-like domain-containing protein n=1 Tax=Roseihalotalea indica TaxID=2867963 RepID=A0AA49GK46_9BACT|nr:PKD-like domain-containing protein [Tunicatimonas sp. TK19036]
MRNLWVYFSLLTFFGFSVSCSDDPEATGSKACFDWIPATGKVGEPVQFSNCSEGAAEYAWSLDGEVFSTEAEHSYTFTQTGDYEVKL